MSAPVLFVTIGLPGVSKTTAARALASKHNILRLTPDEWMKPLFADPDADGRGDIIEARMIDVACQVLRSGVGVILDFGCWSPEECWALHALADAYGAGFELVVPQLDEPERRRRVKKRWELSSSSTFYLSDSEQDEFVAMYRPPTGDELDGSPIPSPPTGFGSWGEWVVWRWPSAPLVETRA